MKRLYNNRGYTLLFAALTAALVLGVAVFILSVSRKQYILASTARDSMFSIYAADSGIECVALRNANWNNNFGIISSSTIRGENGAFYLDCNGTQFPMTQVTDNPTHDTIDEDDISQTRGYIDTGGGTCAEITITTGRDAVDDKIKKVYDSRGYNLCRFSGGELVGPNFDSPRTVERALRLTYGGVW